MPSPFPGMDPYIETPELWSDFHVNLGCEMRAQLNQVLQPRYFARLAPGVAYKVIEESLVPVEVPLCVSGVEIQATDSRQLVTVIEIGAGARRIAGVQPNTSPFQFDLLDAGHDVIPLCPGLTSSACSPR